MKDLTPHFDKKIPPTTLGVGGYKISNRLSDSKTLGGSPSRRYSRAVDEAVAVDEIRAANVEKITVTVDITVEHRLLSARAPDADWVAVGVHVAARKRDVPRYRGFGLIPEAHTTF
jgi:hypothetical protein